MSPATPSFIATRLQQVAAELEDRHESALADLRGQLSQAEVEKMQSQLACLRMEAQLHEASAAAATAAAEMAPNIGNRISAL